MLEHCLTSRHSPTAVVPVELPDTDPFLCAGGKPHQPLFRGPEKPRSANSACACRPAGRAISLRSTMRNSALVMFGSASLGVATSDGATPSSGPRSASGSGSSVSGTPRSPCTQRTASVASTSLTAGPACSASARPSTARSPVAQCKSCLSLDGRPPASSRSPSFVMATTYPPCPPLLVSTHTRTMSPRGKQRRRLQPERWRPAGDGVLVED